MPCSIVNRTAIRADVVCDTLNEVSMVVKTMRSEASGDFHMQPMSDEQTGKPGTRIFLDRPVDMARLESVVEQQGGSAKRWNEGLTREHAHQPNANDSGDHSHRPA